MSPIGRVFIVLNLVLAGTFAGFGGTYLQNQHNWKSAALEKDVALKTKTEEYQIERTRLENELNATQIAKTQFETSLGATEGRLAAAEDENKRLHQQLAAFEGDMKQLLSLSQAANTEAKGASEKAQAAYQMAIADQKAKDEAVSAKNAAEAENRTLKTTIASLEEVIKGKDLNLADLEKERSRLGLLVAVAKQNGFVEGMAAPSLAGTVTTATGTLCTIQVTDNPGNVDIANQIATNPFRFAVYDSTGYKGEAVATRYVADANAVLCNVMLTNGDRQIKEGDRASTKTP
jgi:hypothetical protein